MSVLRSCGSSADSGKQCYRVRYHNPIETEDFKGVYLWLDTSVVDDTSKSVSSSKKEKATAFYEYHSKSAGTYDTIDLTNLVEEYLEEWDSLQVALFCEYDDDKDPGSVQRLFLHFGDDIAPSLISVKDSVWTTGALFDWYRPTDQTDFYTPQNISGPIFGYNVVLYAVDESEDIRDLKITLYSPNGVDSLGKELYKRHARVRFKNDSLYVDPVNHDSKVKNFLRFAVLDGEGFDTSCDSCNHFRMVVEGLKAKSQYTIGFSAWDSAGNSSGTEGTTTVESNRLFMTTDSVAPLMPTKIFTVEDTLFPGLARLDSNNRLLIYWNRSVDPYEKKHGIKIDTVLTLPVGCSFPKCYDTVATYVVERYNVKSEEWEECTYGDGYGKYSRLYEYDKGMFEHTATGTFVTDTIRWVSPGDTLILRIRAVDKSGYYSIALVDTIAVSPGRLANVVECPAGFVPVSIGDTNIFCMEQFEHRDENGEFVHNVLYSEAVETCGNLSVEGFTSSLCNEREWELVCLSGGKLSYGVVEENLTSASEYLYAYCNVSTNDSLAAADISKRDSRCVNPMGVRDMAGQYQEWAVGRSKDTAAVVKGASYLVLGGINREDFALCTNRSFPYFTRLAYTKDTVYLYREGTRVDTVFQKDTSRTLYATLTEKNFTDSLQFFDVQDSSGNSIGTDYALYSEYKQGGEEWLKKLSNGLVYKPDHIEVVFLTGEKLAYRKAASFYKNPAIGFRCCLHPDGASNSSASK